jgi:hypothetical protein
MLCPNAARHTSEWGLDPVAGRFVRTKRTRLSNGRTLETISEQDYSAVESKYIAPWWLCHRIDLHDMLKKLAIEHGAKVLTNTKVVGFVSLQANT